MDKPHLLPLVENDLEQQLFNDRKLSIKDNFQRKGDKTGGANSPGKFGGFYKRIASPSSAPEVLFKQDTSHRFLFGEKRNTDKDIAEVIAGRLLKKIMGDDAASVGLVKYDSNLGFDKTGENTYVFSILLKNSIDLYKHVHVKNNPKIPVPATRPRFFGLEQIAKAFLQGDYTGFEKVSIGSLLVRDFDIHSANIMVEQETSALKRIDFGGALRGLEDHLNPHSLIEHLPGFGPTNHYCDYPTELRVNKGIADEMDRVSRLDLAETISAAISYVGDFYDVKPLKAFAKRLGMPHKQLVKHSNTKESLLAEIATFLQNKIKNRQASLKKIALEIRIDIAIKKNQYGKFELSDDLVDLILSNRDYFLARLKDKRFHFRAEEHKGKNWFDRLFGYTRRKLANKLVLITNAIINGEHKDKFSEVHSIFKAINNSVIRRELTNKLYSKIIVNEFSADWPNETIQIVIEKINGLFLKNQPLETLTARWLREICTIDMPAELKTILKSMVSIENEKVPILDVAITQHNINLSSPYLIHTAHYPREGVQSLQAYNKKAATPLMVDPQTILEIGAKGIKKSAMSSDTEVCKGILNAHIGMFSKPKIIQPVVAKQVVNSNKPSPIISLLNR